MSTDARLVIIAVLMFLAVLAIHALTGCANAPTPYETILTVSEWRDGEWKTVSITRTELEVERGCTKDGE